MVGLNVAVRAGAQGIGFAIPVNKAIDVATRLMSVERLERHWHGMTPLSIDGPLGPVTIGRIDRDSPAATSGLKRGDELREIGSVSIKRPLDVERALLGRRTGERVPVLVSRQGQEVSLDLVLADAPRGGRQVASDPTPAPTRPNGAFQQATWEAFGLLLVEEQAEALRARGLPLEGGMRVVAVKPGSSAADKGVVAGDILVQIHRWWTTSEQDVRYILSRGDALQRLGSVRFEIVRGSERYFGQLALGNGGTTRR
jgi:serine protease Do